MLLIISSPMGSDTNAGHQPSKLQDMLYFCAATEPCDVIPRMCRIDGVAGETRDKFVFV